MSIQAIQRSSLWSYPGALIKQTAIGGIAALVNNVIKYSMLRSACHSLPQHYSNYLCLLAHALIDVNKYRNVIIPIVQLKDRILSVVQPLIPFNPLIKNAVGNAISEELLFRVLFQQVFFVALAKLPSIANLFSKRGKKLQNRVQQDNFPSPVERSVQILSHPMIRILISSSIFAFCHFGLGDSFYISQFLSGITYGIVFEKYGFIAATTSHSITTYAGLLVQRELQSR